MALRRPGENVVVEPAGAPQAPPMYIPPEYALTDEAILAEVVRAHPFATVIAVAQTEPVVSHVPLILDRNRLLGHVAVANPLAAIVEGARLTAIFHGPHAYVSPRWYASPGRVPTWNYVAVHASGRASTLEGEAAIDALRMLCAAFERGQDPFRVDELSEAALRALARGIRVFAVAIDRLVGKAKLGQDKPLADRIAAARVLATGGADASEVARWMHAVAIDRDE